MTAPDKLANTVTWETKRGHEYAALPVYHPAVPKQAPHGWMGVVDSHIIGVMNDTYEGALEQAKAVAEMPRRKR